MNNLLKKFLIIIPPLILLFILLKGRNFNNDYFLPQENLIQNGWMLPGNLDGWISTDMKWFPENIMFEKIDGRATFYRQIGADGLLAGSWIKNGKSWNMYLYKMKNDNAAKQAFSSERNDKFTKINIGDDAYFVSGSLTFRAQNLYMQLIADNPNDDAYSVTGLAVKISNELLSEGKNDDSKDNLNALAFAKDFMVPGSDNFIAEDAFGYTSLKNVDTLLCVINFSTTKWIFIKNGNNIFNDYTNELIQYDCENFFVNENSAGGDMFGEWEIGGIINSNFFGVREAKNKKQLLEHWEAINNQ